MSFPISDVDDASLAPIFARYSGERILDSVGALSGRLTLQRILIDHSTERIATSAFSADDVAAKAAFASLTDAAVARRQLRARAAASGVARARLNLRHAVTRLACAREAVIRILALHRVAPNGVASIVIGNDSLAQKHAAERFALAVREHASTLGGPDKAACWVKVADAVVDAFHAVRDADAALSDQRRAVRAGHAALQGVVSELNEMLRVVYWDEPSAVARLKRRTRRDDDAAAAAVGTTNDAAAASATSCCLPVASFVCSVHDSGHGAGASRAIAPTSAASARAASATATTATTATAVTIEPTTTTPTRVAAAAERVAKHEQGAAARSTRPASASEQRGGAPDTQADSMVTSCVMAQTPANTVGSRNGGVACRSESS